MSDFWNGQEIRLWAKIGGVELEVSRFHSRTGLNSIPTASLVLPLGRDAINLRDSPAHALDWGKRLPVEVFLQVKTTGFLGSLGLSVWGKKPLRLFLGDTNGHGFELANSASSFVVECEHWLSGLGFASAISAVNVPNNPSDLTFGASLGERNESEVAARLPRSGHFIGDSLSDGHMSPENIEKDFWGAGVKPFFRELANLEEFFDTEADEVVDIQAAAANTEALAALARFEPVAGKYEFGVPLSLDPNAYGGQIDLVAQEIASSMAGETLEGFAGTTLWDKLVGYAGNFMFSVVPLVETALVVPVIPGLSATWRTISTAEYEAVRFQGGSPRPLRGVGIYGGFGFYGGASLGGGADSPSVGGYFQGERTGQVVFKQSPAWMSFLAINSPAPERVTGASSSALFPEASSLLATAAALANSKLRAHATLMGAYARALYAQEVLKTRAVDLTGRLRVDIAPGSMVKVERDPRKFLAGQDTLGQNVYGTVMQVDHMIDAETPKATTTFHISHLRSESEIDKPGYSVDKHPLWSKLWLGAPLVKIGA